MGPGQTDLMQFLEGLRFATCPSVRQTMSNTLLHTITIDSKTTVFWLMNFSTKKNTKHKQNLQIGVSILHQAARSRTSTRFTILKKMPLLQSRAFGVVAFYWLFIVYFLTKREERGKKGHYLGTKVYKSLQTIKKNVAQDKCSSALGDKIQRVSVLPNSKKKQNWGQLKLMPLLHKISIN